MKTSLDPAPGKEALGIKLAGLMLRLTGNRALADACSVLPLVPRQQFLLLAEPANQSQSVLLSEGPWVLWSPSAQQPERSQETS